MGTRNGALLYDRLAVATKNLISWFRDFPGGPIDEQIEKLAEDAVPMYSSDVLALAGDIPDGCWQNDDRAKAELMVAAAANEYFTRSLMRHLKALQSTQREVPHG